MSAKFRFLSLLWLWSSTHLDTNIEISFVWNHSKHWCKQTKKSTPLCILLTWKISTKRREKVKSCFEAFPFQLRLVFFSASRWRPAADDSCPGGLNPADVSTASVKSNQQSGLPVGEDAAWLRRSTLCSSIHSLPCPAYRQIKCQVSAGLTRWWVRPVAVVLSFCAASMAAWVVDQQRTKSTSWGGGTWKALSVHNCIHMMNIFQNKQ